MTQIRVMFARNRAHIVRFDDADLDLWNSRRWSLSRQGYVRANVHELGKQRTLWFARAVMGCDFGDGKIVDHINRDVRDNRRSNLRFVTLQENQRNRKAKVKGHHPEWGVVWEASKGYWRASVTVNYKVTSRYFRQEQDAIDAAREMRSGWRA